MSTSSNVFISWSGERSRAAAEALRTWLPMVIQSAKPWMSETDIEKGTRGLSELAKALEAIKVGISCLTPENLSAPWLLFEAGALSKTVDDKSRLYTYLLGGLNPTDVTAPLSTFQAARADRAETRRVLHSINRTIASDPLPEASPDELFVAMWPRLEEKLHAIPEPAKTVEAKRSMEDMVTEILEWTRAESGSRAAQFDWVSEAMRDHTTLVQNPSFQSAGAPAVTLAELMSAQYMKARRAVPPVPGALKRAADRVAPSRAGRSGKGQDKKE